MSATRFNSWKEIAEAARKEHDPEKLIALVTELNRVLTEQQEQFSLDPPATQESSANGMPYLRR